MVMLALLQLELSPTRIPIKPVSLKHKQKKKGKLQQGERSTDLSGKESCAMGCTQITCLSNVLVADQVASLKDIW
jgi:hypothetical protein